MFASKYDREDTVLITAYTASAANEIEGEHMHSYHGWQLFHENKEMKSEVEKKLMKVKLVIVDEVSQINQVYIGYQCLNFQKIFCRETAQENWKPYGGVSVVFVGDWFQMRPVDGSSFWKQQLNSNSSTQNERALAGQAAYFVWTSINWVVVLNNSWRHKEFPEWNAILQKSRIGHYNAEMIDKMNQYCFYNDSNSDIVAGNDTDNHSGKRTDSPINYYCPLITTSNLVRNGYNLARTLAFAKELKRKSKQQQSSTIGDSLNSNHTISALLNDPSTLFEIPTSYRKEWLPLFFEEFTHYNAAQRLPILLTLCIGQPIYTTEGNRNNGYTNNTLGILCKIVWEPNTVFTVKDAHETGLNVLRPDRLPVFLVMKLMKPTNYPFKVRHLPEENMVIVTKVKRSRIMLSTIDKSGHLKKAFHEWMLKKNPAIQKLPNTITVTHFPISSAFAITTDKSQGSTFQSVIVDINQKSSYRKNPP